MVSGGNENRKKKKQRVCLDTITARMYRPDLTVSDEREWKSTLVNIKANCGQAKGDMGASDVPTGEHPADINAPQDTGSWRGCSCGVGRLAHRGHLSSLVAGNSLSRHCDNHNRLTDVQCTPCLRPKVLGLAKRNVLEVLASSEGSFSRLGLGSGPRMGLGAGV